MVVYLNLFCANILSEPICRINHIFARLISIKRWCITEFKLDIFLRCNFSFRPIQTDLVNPVGALKVKGDNVENEGSGNYTCL